MKKSFVLRLEGRVFELLKKQASKQERSINSYCVSLLSQKLGDFKADSNQLLIDRIKKFYGSKVMAVVLFGSVARGTENSASDIDLLLVLDEAISVQGSLYREWDAHLEGVLEAKISPHFVHLPKDLLNAGSLWLEVALEGKVLLDTSDTVAKLLRKLRVLIAEGHFTRAYSYGVPYWKKVA